MDDAQLLKRLMTRAADQGRPPFEAPPAALFADRPHERRHVGLSMAAAVLVVLALLVPVTLVANSRAHNKSLGVPNPLPTLGSVSAASLAHYKWSLLPTAPIPGRSSGVGVWTGEQMIVWGGSSGHDGEVLHADGAAYEPDTRTWSTLPPGPLSARSSPAFVWTGTSVFVWGGYVGDGVASATDGALYTPADHTWRRLPAAPVTVYGDVRAFWTGRVVVLVSTPPWTGQNTSPGANNGSEKVDAQAYNPATRSWTRLPDLRLPADRKANLVVDLGVGNQIYVWSLWSLNTMTGPGSFSTAAGVDGYTLEVEKRRWTSNSLALPDQMVSSSPLWTGHDIVMPAISLWLGLGPSGPIRTNISGVVLDPSTSATRPIRHGPVDDLRPQYLWIGATMLAVNTGTETSSGKKHVSPGRAAVWNPTTNTWTTLPNAPFSGNELVAVWTGNKLVVWGQLFTPRGGNPAAGSGLVFAP